MGTVVILNMGTGRSEGEGRPPLVGERVTLREFRPSDAIEREGIGRDPEIRLMYGVGNDSTPSSPKDGRRTRSLCTGTATDATNGRQAPGGRYVVFASTAASTSAGVSNTTVRTVAPPEADTVSAAAAAETLSG